MKKRVPDEYWLALAERLAVQNPTLYQEVLKYHFDVRNIGYGKVLSLRLIEVLTNIHSYASSTFLTKMKEAVGNRERDARKSPTT